MANTFYNKLPVQIRQVNDKDLKYEDKFFYSETFCLVNKFETKVMTVKNNCTICKRNTSIMM